MTNQPINTDHKVYIALNPHQETESLLEKTNIIRPLVQEMFEYSELKFE